MSATWIVAAVVLAVVGIGVVVFVRLWIQAKDVAYLRRRLVLLAVAFFVMAIGAMLLLRNGQLWQPALFAVAGLLQLYAARLDVRGAKPS